ncbi:MAG: serine/threonine-protein kinase [Myxococcota bacterium]
MAETTRLKTVGAYRIDSVVGRGGMGEVYKAYHELLDRPVALKRLPPGEPQDRDEQRERFLREGRALARLHHQNIVAVYDLFERRGELFMAMEFVDGYDLAAILEKGALPMDVTCIVGIEVAAALEAAHHEGIVHRDVKAANVMVARDGAVRLMDFGIAKQAEDDGVTRTGLVMGTPRFLAPELLVGGEADARSDVYALGALLYHCLAGVRIYEDITMERLFHAIQGGRYKPLKDVAPQVPRALRKLIERCLHRRPERRVPNPSDLRQQLEAMLASMGGWANHRERMVGFLTARGRLTQEEASHWLDASGLVVTSTFTAVRPGLVGRIARSGWVWTAAAVGAIVLGTYQFGAAPHRLTEWLSAMWIMLKQAFLPEP